jgi:hypothetical protein
MLITSRPLATRQMTIAGPPSLYHGIYTDDQICQLHQTHSLRRPVPANPRPREAVTNCTEDHNKMFRDCRTLHDLDEGYESTHLTRGIVIVRTLGGTSNPADRISRAVRPW